ncbi:TonB-dependent receptor [Hyphomicrobium sp. D-2]|uniref:TonB-dependent receptor domain-containing protein n=1 Tax=Hyphomicrobium sp. D-2 TaxID=3041621 RepID=UPI0024581C6E|nr:TonB-dependent receptor [Hyphomicrobium sp. D-2]MDH4981583.1 TonB-dependent receptor [Hyphomicrobium sp. D-2]
MRCGGNGRRAEACRAGVAASWLAICACVGAIGVAPELAFAQTAQKKSFNIPAGSLAQALAAFGKQAGLQVSYPSELTAGKTSAGVSGSLTASEALSAILAGSGLSYSFANASTVSISGADSGAGATVDGAIALDTIDVSGGGGSASAAADEPYQTPGSSAHISADQIQQVRPSRAGDVFNGTPGVIAASKNTGGGVDVNIRGMQGMGRVKVMVDGTQQDSNTYRGYYGADNRSYFDPDLIGGVDIEKGPSDGPYGSGAMGGVVNFKTLNADDILKPGSSYGARIRGGIGGNTIAPSLNPFMARPESEEPELFSFDNKFGSVAIATRSEHLDVVGAVVKRQHGNYFAGKYGPETVTYAGDQWNPSITTRYAYNNLQEEVPNTSESTTSTLLKGTLKYGDHALELGHSSYDSENGYVYPLWAGQAQRQQFLLSQTTSNRYTAKYKFTPADNDLLDVRFNVWRSDLESKDPYQRQAGWWHNILETEAWGVDAWNRSRFDTLVGSASLQYGLEYSSSEFSASEQYPNAAPFAKVSGTRELGGAFLRGSLDLTSWLAVNGGLRYDAYRTEATPRNSASISNEGNALLPSAGITVTPWSGIQLFGKYAEGYRPPTVREIAGTSGDGSGWAGPNPNLRPEQSESWEVGVNALGNDLLRQDDQYRLKVAYFDSSYADYITLGSATHCGLCFMNVKQATFKGIEATAQYDAGVFFASGMLNYYTHVDLGSDPYGLMYEHGMGYVPPKFTTSATVGVRLFDQRLTLGTRVAYHGQRASPYLFLPPYSTVRFTPHLTTADVFGHYNLNDHTKIEFSVENLTDQYYVDPLAVAAIAAPGRTARMGFTMMLDEQGDYSSGGISIPEITTPSNGYDWSGAFVGLSGSYFTGEGSGQGDFAGTFRTGTRPNFVWIPYAAAMQTTHDPAGLTGGVFAGYNKQLNSPVVLGVDANVDYVNPFELISRGTGPAVSSAVTRTLSTTVTSGVDWQAGVRGRFGLAFDRTLPYIAGGLAIAQYRYSYTSFTLDQAVSTTTRPDPTGFKGTYIGWTLGAGVEHAVTDHMLFRAEYRHNDFGKKTFDTPAGAHKVELTSDEWKLGLAYKF